MDKEFLPIVDAIESVESNVVSNQNIGDMSDTSNSNAANPSQHGSIFKGHPGTCVDSPFDQDQIDRRETSSTTTEEGTSKPKFEMRKKSCAWVNHQKDCKNGDRCKFSHALDGEVYKAIINSEECPDQALCFYYHPVDPSE